MKNLVQRLNLVMRSKANPNVEWMADIDEGSDDDLNESKEGMPCDREYSLFVWTKTGDEGNSNLDLEPVLKMNEALINDDISFRFERADAAVK